MEFSFFFWVDRLLKHLWGDWYFDAASKKWTTAGEDKGLKRGFVQFVLDPIYKVKEAVMEAKEDDMRKLLDRLGVKLTDAEKKQETKTLYMVFLVWIKRGKFSDLPHPSSQRIFPCNCENKHIQYEYLPYAKTPHRSTKNLRK